MRRVADSQDRRVSQEMLNEQVRDLIEKVFQNHAEAVSREMSLLSTEEQVQMGGFAENKAGNLGSS